MHTILCILIEISVKIRMAKRMRAFKLKFIYYEKAKKFCDIFTLLLSYVMPVKSKVKISQNFVTFLEYMNFTYVSYLKDCYIYRNLRIQTKSKSLPMPCVIFKKKIDWSKTILIPKYFWKAKSNLDKYINNVIELSTDYAFKIFIVS